jgi:hypothetical protein
VNEVNPSFPTLFDFAIKPIIQDPQQLRHGQVCSDLANKIVVALLHSGQAQATHFMTLQNATVCDMSHVSKENTACQPVVLQEIIYNYMPTLETLKLPSSIDFPPLNLPGRRFVRLHTLHIPSLGKCSQEKLDALCETLPEQMDELVINDCKELQVILKRPMQIRKLVINSSSITNKELQELSQCIGQHVKSLEFKGCKNITGFQGCSFPKLEEINLGVTHMGGERTRLTDEGLRQLALAAPGLKKLIV